MLSQAYLDFAADQVQEELINIERWRTGLGPDHDLVKAYILEWHCEETREAFYLSSTSERNMWKGTFLLFVLESEGVCI